MNATGNEPSVIPALRISVSPDTDQIRPQHSIKTTARRAESRKLLAHVLDQLSTRALPPSVYESYKVHPSDTATSTVGGIFVRQATRPAGNPGTQGENEGVDDDEDEASQQGFSTESTFELMTQLRDVLAISRSQGWQIFEDNSYHPESKPKSSSPFRRSVTQKRAVSPGRGDFDEPELLTRCISILASVVAEDCRFKIASPRPNRPPNSLQALTLEIARFLLHLHRDDSSVITRITYAVLPAFSTFPPEMYARLLQFYDEAVIRANTEFLQHRGEQTNSPEIHSLDIGTPLVSITVDHVEEDIPQDAGWRPWSTPDTNALNFTASNSPRQTIDTFRISSLIPVVMSSVLENIDLSTVSNYRIEVRFWLHRLFDLLFRAKPDAYLDLLETMAFSSARARQSAATLLATFFARTIGHVTVSRPFPASYYEVLGIGREASIPSHHPYTHQFVPWKYIYGTDCRACAKSISGFGLFCPFCFCSVHFDCYDHPDGSRLVKYPMVSDPDIKGVATYRFSHILPSRTGLESSIQRNGHTFRLVSFFTLPLCFACKRPLWGTFAQGMKCTKCMCILHSACASSASLPSCSNWTFNSTHVTIHWADLRDSCTVFYRDLFHSNQRATTPSFEEMSIVYGFLWLQVQLMTKGVAMGTVVVMQNGRNAAHAKEHRVDAFELHHHLEHCQASLSAATLPLSGSTDDYLRESMLPLSSHTFMFDWSHLVFLVSGLKVPQPTAVIQTPSESYPFEAVSLAHLRDMLGRDFNVHSDQAAHFFLTYLHHLGFFDRSDMDSRLLPSDHPVEKRLSCVFPLPLGLDPSKNVETLFTAIEACLGDIDLCINEAGLLLLTRRIWPSGLGSEYAFKRITRAILQWISAEDTVLSIILREYVSKQLPLPGVRSGHDAQPWPSVQTTRSNFGSSINNGGDYLAARRCLLAYYARPWLKALHDQDPHSYASMIYELCVEHADGPFSLNITNMSAENLSRRDELDSVLKRLVRLSHSAILFTIWENLFIRWLNSVSDAKQSMEFLPSLYRLLSREGDSTQRYSAADAPALQGDEITPLDPWKIFARIGSDLDVHRTLPWLCLLANSGVDVPPAIFLLFSSHLGNRNAPLSNSVMLSRAILSSTWLKSLGRQQLQSLFVDLHTRHSTEITEALKEDDQMAIDFIRISLAVCLLLYGCDRSQLVDQQLISPYETDHLPSRRRLLVRGEEVSDPIIVQSGIMMALERYIATEVEQVSCLVAKFLFLFFTASPLVESYEIDNFILRNGAVLAKCAWHFYGLHAPEITKVRTLVLLRILVVDALPLRDLIEADTSSSVDWEARLSALFRLFRILLEVNSPAFMIEDRQWRPSVTDLFYHFFKSLWSDQQEEVRLAIEASSNTLLSTHFEAITLCWNETLTKAPVAERTKLTAFLIQLHAHFPRWQVVSWDVVVEVLQEYTVIEASQASPIPGTPPIDVVRGLDTRLRVSTLLLSLGMISNGISIAFHDVLRIKEHLVRALGFDNVTLIPSLNGETFFVEFGDARVIPDVAVPCVHELLLVLDAPHPLDLAAFGLGLQGKDGTALPLLVGSPYVDIVLGLICTISDLINLPALTLKSLLEALTVAIYKHDFEKSLLRPLQRSLRRAVSITLNILLEDINYECRQQALSALQAYIKRFALSPGPFLYLAIEQVARFIASESHTSQDVLVGQARTFFESMLVTHCQNGILLGMFKRRLEPEFFPVLKQVIDANAKANPLIESLRVTLLQDLLLRMAESEQSSLQNISNNLKLYLDTYHQGYSPEMMLLVGQQLTSLIRRVAELSPESVPTTPLLSIPSLLIQHNKLNSRDLLSYTDTILRVCLHRLYVKAVDLAHLIHVTSALYRKTGAEGSSNQNIITNTLFEILGEALQLKSRVLPATVRAMLEAILSNEGRGASLAMTHLNQFLELADSGFYYLQNHIWLDVLSEDDFSACLGIGDMILKATKLDPSLIPRLVEQTTERTIAQHTSVRAWNILALSALLDDSDHCISVVFNQLQAFSLSHGAMIRNFVQSGVGMADIADINYTYISIKLWLLLAYKKSGYDGSGNIVFMTVWNELWSPFESLVTLLEAQFHVGQIETVAILTWSTVADIFLFVRALQVPIALENAGHVSLLQRLKALGGRGEAHVGKLTRALRSIAEPAQDSAFISFVNQAAKDIVAAEKLRVLEKDRRVTTR